ncbi:hypothetical protein CHS0354_015623 [Potamilus streckersoni]|uniref:Orn/DAP/Arg decarboxylase 2 C-terminal domain-containing protein n=1 Tax=Potamilus streckersoni TaxID=2493646 RepID=A0AAE0WE36_9BIVA|nr:hypothetical protein CHS0354_015623 [Potamilus streckersoni]
MQQRCHVRWTDSHSHRKQRDWKNCYTTNKTNEIWEPEIELTYECSLWGPTCDGLDCIIETTHLPELKVGDWLVFLDMDPC